MARMYFRYGLGKTSDLCQTAYNYNEQNMNVLVINADHNKKIESKVIEDNRVILSRDINFELNNDRLFKRIYDITMMANKKIECILIDNAHMLKKEDVDDLFYISKLLNITVIAYGDRVVNNYSSKGSMRLMELSDTIEQVDSDEPISRPKLQFFYGAMNCGKTSKLIYKAYTLKAEGMKVCIIKPKIDRNDAYIETRIGLKEKADIVLDTNDHIYGEGYYMNKDHINYLLVDEAQFLTKTQIDELSRINKEFDLPIRCYGLKSDFMTNHFEGSGRLLEISDELLKLKTICQCGAGATFNARQDKNGNFVKNGEQICVDDGKKYYYVQLCGNCYIKEVQGIENAKDYMKELKI